jgi:pimeloyl-ACP methyl ester carboxylesterase
MIVHSEYPYPVKKVFLKNKLEIAYMEVGKGEVSLTFVHGLASYAPIWEKNLEVLQKYYRCVALDLPGHGLSSEGDFSYSIDFYAQTVREWLELIGNTSTILIGHSMGGQIVTHLALQEPTWFSHLVLVAPAGFETFSPTEKIWLNQFTSGSVLGSSQYLKWLLNLKNYFYDLNEWEYEKLKEFNRDFYSVNDNVYLAKILSRSSKAMMDEPIFDRLSDLEMPTLVLFGKNDQLIPNKFLHPWQTTETLAQTGAQQLQRGKLKLYERCGHFLQYEQSAQFNIDLYKFLNPLIFREFV